MRNFKRSICLGLTLLFANFQAYAVTCGVWTDVGGKSWYSIKNDGTNINTFTAGSSYTAHNWVGTGYPKVDAVIGNNIVYDVDTDAVFTGGLVTKLNDSGMRSQALRFPGGMVAERYDVSLDGNTSYYTTGDYNSASTTLTRTPTTNGASNSTDYKEFINRASQVGAKRLYFVANVQEAFARCMPDTSGNCKLFYPPDNNLDNVDPENSSVHWTTIDQAASNFSGKAKRWAGLINDKMTASSYFAEVYWEIGNELYTPSDYNNHYVTPSQYNMVLNKYNTDIKTASATNITGGWKIGAVGVVSDNSWWTALTSNYFDFGVVHDYGRDFLVNPTLSNSNCTSGAGKQDADHPCRTTDWYLPNGGNGLTTLSGWIGNKKVAITEFNTADVGINWWLNDTTYNGQHYKVAPIKLIDAMVNSILLFGNYYSSGNAVLQDVLLWPTRSDRTDLTPYGGDYNNNYRSIVNQNSPYAAMATQDGFLHIKDAISGSWQGDNNGAYKRDYLAHFAIFQTENDATGHRYIVIANGNTSAVQIPINVSTKYL